MTDITTVKIIQIWNPSQHKKYYLYKFTCTTKCIRHIHCLKEL